jgi:hypothetical protein
VSELAFISPGAAPLVSPLAETLAGATGIGDLSLLGKLEVRNADPGPLPDGASLIRISPERTLVLCPAAERAVLKDALPGFVVDLTAALAGISVEGEPLVRRLTDLDLDALPAAGKVAGVPALVTRDGDAFGIFFAQEYGASVVELVRDVQEGLA